jgi:hypothetical protein
MKPAESYSNQGEKTQANQKVNMLLQNIIEEINESKTLSMISPSSKGDNHK